MSYPLYNWNNRFSIEILNTVIQNNIMTYYPLHLKWYRIFRGFIANAIYQMRTQTISMCKLIEVMSFVQMYYFEMILRQTLIYENASEESNWLCSSSTHLWPITKITNSMVLWSNIKGWLNISLDAVSVQYGARNRIWTVQYWRPPCRLVTWFRLSPWRTQWILSRVIRVCSRGSLVA